MRRAVLVLALVALSRITIAAAGPREGDEMPFLGLRALVVKPSARWEEWDVSVYGALEERGFEVTYGGSLEDPNCLPNYDLTALDIRYELSAAEARALESYVAQGGALYVSWGGSLYGSPEDSMGAAGFLREVLGADSLRSVRSKGVSLQEGPLAQGISDRDLLLAQRVPPISRPPAEGWLVVVMNALPGGVVAVKDAQGDVLGVLSEHGKGRAAVLGLGFEQDKFFAKPESAPPLLDNLLTWLLREKLESGARRWSNRIAVAVPARAEVTGVQVNGKPIADFTVTRAGSVRKVELCVDAIQEGAKAEVRVAYRPLAQARNVETVIHLPWGTLRQAADSPADLADYLKSLGATMCQPLLRASGGQAWYKGMPQDRPDQRLVTEYHGNFLSDLIGECHQRGIKVIGGVYFDSATPVRIYPEATQIDSDGSPRLGRNGESSACFNNPKGQAHNLATIEQLLRDYELDGIILDDNYELDWYVNNCFCEYCERGLREHCEAKGIPYRPPAEGYGRPGRHEYRQQATRALVAKVQAIGRVHGRSAGGWVSVTMDSLHVAGSFDFLGGMAYTSPPRSVRAILPRLGDCEYTCLLWAPQVSPETIEREAREAVHAGCASVGFWVMGGDGGYRPDPGREAAIQRAFGGAEEEWKRFYSANLLSGDARFVLLEGEVGRENAVFRIRNTGKKVERRVQGPVSLKLAR